MILISILSTIIVILSICLCVLAAVADYKNKEYPTIIVGLALILIITVFALGLVLIALNI